MFQKWYPIKGPLKNEILSTPISFFVVNIFSHMFFTRFAVLYQARYHNVLHNKNLRFCIASSEYEKYTVRKIGHFSINGKCHGFWL